MSGNCLIVKNAHVTNFTHENYRMAGVPGNLPPPKYSPPGPSFLGNMPPRGPYFVGNLAWGGGANFRGGAKFPVTPVRL